MHGTRPRSGKGATAADPGQPRRVAVGSRTGSMAKVGFRRLSRHFRPAPSRRHRSAAGTLTSTRPSADSSHSVNAGDASTRCLAKDERGSEATSSSLRQGARGSCDSLARAGLSVSAPRVPAVSGGMSRPGPRRENAQGHSVQTNGPIRERPLPTSRRPQHRPEDGRRQATLGGEPPQTP